jgi:hypothetical protein
LGFMEPSNCFCPRFITVNFELVFGKALATVIVNQAT